MIYSSSFKPPPHPPTHPPPKQAKNGLENYAFSIRNTINEPQVAEKISSSDKETVESKIKETTDWLDTHQSAEKEVRLLIHPPTHPPTHLFYSYACMERARSRSPPTDPPTHPFIHPPNPSLTY